MESIDRYLEDIGRYSSDPQSSEMSYRTPFQTLLETMFPKTEGYTVQHDARAVAGNKPDFYVLKGELPILYLEVKNVGHDLDRMERSEQAARYFGYDNLIISDYLSFRFYRNGERYESPITLATLDKTTRALTPNKSEAEHLVRSMREFVASHKEPIRRGAHLAKIMGGKAQRIRDNVTQLLKTDEAKGKNELEKMMRVIRENLLATITPESFADMYAQTLVYGLFAARYHDPTPDTFSRAEARELVPATNPFLRDFFDHLAGPTFPKRLDYIVSELCEVFSHADVRALMEEYFKQTDLFNTTHEAPDPVIHFYEDFLREYDPKKKAEMGVFYTPLPVVRALVRGIDELLKRDFGLSQGLADTSRISHTSMVKDDKGKVRKDTHQLHRVQILDFATGTGTFLNETVTHIYEHEKSRRGRWTAYVNEDLLPRLHGFELMMASYTIAHLKLALTLRQSGIDKTTERLGIYLTNTLDTPHETTLQGGLFGFLESIAEENRLASRVKRDTPVMVVMGNPPYSGESQNPHYHEHDVYKVEPGGKQKLKEKNSKWLNDDYVKFIRFAEQLVEKNGEGVMGLITAHGYLDNPTFRGMRWHLRNTFDTLYIVDLHGNANKKEAAPDGSKDENVFDIKTGVALIWGVKKYMETGTKKKPLAHVYHAELYGTRHDKFAALDELSLTMLDWHELPAETDVWKVEGEGRTQYEEGFSVAELFPERNVGIVTARDALCIQHTTQAVEAVLTDFEQLPVEELRTKYALGKDARDWSVAGAKKDVQKGEGRLTPIAYRPFDVRQTYFTGRSKGFHCMPRGATMQHFFRGENLGLMTCRQTTGGNWNHVLLTDKIVDDSYVSNRSKERGYCFPLYMYADDGTRRPNLSPELVARIESVVGTTTPEDIFDYVYAVLHAPTYRSTYKEFLKSDFPRVPYPKDTDTFWKLVPLGRTLRALHLLESPLLTESGVGFPVAGTDMVEKPRYDAQNGRVYINASQYFDTIPKAVWELYIGGYQPAQKYLKDRKDKKLTSAEFATYEKLLASMRETIKLMHDIDKVLYPNANT